jgi:hypothetical protein
MATPTSGQQTADVPRTGGYTRFELELEVRLLSYPGDVMCPWPASIH